MEGAVEQVLLHAEYAWQEQVRWFATGLMIMIL